MHKFQLHDIEEQLRLLGIQEGDVLLLKVDMAQVGLIEGRLKTGLLDALRNVVGPSGTLVISTFTQNHFISFIKKDTVFTKETRPNTGVFARLILDVPGCIRSDHPTNSFAAIGPEASRILEGHNAMAPSYLPILRLMDQDSKCLSIGCVHSNPGFTTTHWAQYVLGQSTRNILRGLVGAYYLDKGDLKLFKRKDFGGHSTGAIKLYGDYIQHQLLRLGWIGNAYTAVIDTKKAYEVDLKVMGSNPRYILCDNPLCFDCRGSWFYNKRDMPLYFLRAIPRLIKKCLQRKKSR
ncbi:MAG: hypothetical protein EXS67_03035 [Candidatus Margulisbacteria bacterium]|nr:hypothetical protein [Candidatus Margulisiibacteriota bacterium]